MKNNKVTDKNGEKITEYRERVEDICCEIKERLPELIITAILSSAVSAITTVLLRITYG